VRIEAVAAPAVSPAPDPASALQPAEIRLSLPAGMHDLVEPLLGMPGLPPVVLTSDTEADLALVHGVAAAGDPVVRRWIVVTDPLALERDGVMPADLEAAAASARLYVAAEYAALVSRSLPSRASPTPVDSAALVEWLRGVPGALALVPEDRLGVQTRALALDGLDPVRRSGDRAGYPLVTRARFELHRPSTAAMLVASALAAGLAVEPPVTRAVFTGDLIPARCVYVRVRRIGDWSAPFRSTGEFLRAAEIAAGSLDAAISDKGTPIGCRETFSLLGPPEAARGIADAGYDVITVATNHIKDCGVSGPCGDATFLDTLANLESAGIHTAGGGRTLAEARRPALVVVNGVHFAFLGYDDVSRHTNAGPASPGTAPLDEETLAEEIAAARAAADVVILLPQWGEEYTANPTARQRRIAALAIAAGTSLIAGNHPHAVQAARPEGDGYVAYALGNFLFDQDWSRETVEGAILEATFHRARLVAVRLLPIRIENQNEPVFLSGDAGAAVLRRIADAARRLSP
jgi:poly-gamma-glutamate synthesis protein (capsule biosynthesis protein)